MKSSPALHILLVFSFLTSTLVGATSNQDESEHLRKFDGNGVAVYGSIPACFGTLVLTFVGLKDLWVFAFELDNLRSLLEAALEKCGEIVDENDREDCVSSAHKEDRIRFVIFRRKLVELGFRLIGFPFMLFKNCQSMMG